MPLEKAGRLGRLSAVYAVEHHGTQEHAYSLAEFTAATRRISGRCCRPLVAGGPGGGFPAGRRAVFSPAALSRRANRHENFTKVLPRVMVSQVSVWTPALLSASCLLPRGSDRMSLKTKMIAFCLSSASCP
jgi:hypothetical protein